MDTQARRLLEDPPDGTDVLASAPGRANLMGEYTDVNEGFVLPVALDLQTVVAARRRPGVLSLRSLDMPDDGVVEVDLRTGAGPGSGWGRYATAVVTTLLAEGYELQGAEGLVASDVPLGAGLSSSAALEVALALVLLTQDLSPVEVAQLCQRAENDGVGVQSGIMDQLASAAGLAGNAMFLDTRDLALQQVPVPGGLSVLLVDSAVQRSLTDSAYNERRAQCEQAAEELGVRSLRDATPELLEEHWGRMDDVVRRRARHIVTENLRVVAAADALRSGETAALGELFAASHESMSRDFEISVPELDTLVALAVATEGVVASRMTGAGFGGCTVSLVREELADQVRTQLLEQYGQATGRTGRGWVSAVGPGATTHPTGPVTGTPTAGTPTAGATTAGTPTTHRTPVRATAAGHPTNRDAP